MASLFELIAAAQAAHPSVLEDVRHKRQLGWSELDALSARLASLLRGELGLDCGDRVAAQLEKSPEGLCLYLACLRAGLVYLPMNTAYRRDEVEHILGDAEPRAVVADPQAAGATLGGSRMLTLDREGRGTLLERAAAHVTRYTPEPLADGDLACIVYTSGTTGRPKGAMLSHGNLASNARALVGLWGFSERDVLIHALPLFHVHGLFVACHTALLAGARLLWLEKFDDRAVMELLPRATVLMGVPTFYTRLLASSGLSRESVKGMRLFVSGSAPLLPETFAAFRERTGHAILERYGMTETGMNTSNPLKGERRGGSVGFPLPGTEVRIAGEGDQPLPRGAIGGIEVRGPNVFAGYWRKPEKTAEDFTADGWFRTGDQGLIDAEGYVHIVGRARDLIISGGYNVYPKEVELVLDSLPEIAESAVVGIPHPDFGEAVVAVAVPRGPREAPRASEAALLARVKERIAGYKAPKRLVWVDELPRNAMGKVQKNQLRERLARELSWG